MGCGPLSLLHLTKGGSPSVALWRGPCAAAWKRGKKTVVSSRLRLKEGVELMTGVENRTATRVCPFLLGAGGQLPPMSGSGAGWDGGLPVGRRLLGCSQCIKPNTLSYRANEYFGIFIHGGY